MHGLTVQDVVDMAKLRGVEAEPRLEKVHDWRHSRVMDVGKTLAGGGGSLLAALAVSELKHEFDHVPFGLVVALAAIAFLMALGGLAVIVSARGVERELVVALRIFANEHTLHTASIAPRVAARGGAA
jgi:hypothetical protein